MKNDEHNEFNLLDYDINNYLELNL